MGCVKVKGEKSAYGLGGEHCVNGAPWFSDSCSINDATMMEEEEEEEIRRFWRRGESVYDHVEDQRQFHNNFSNNSCSATWCRFELLGGVVLSNPSGIWSPPESVGGVVAGGISAND